MSGFWIDDEPYEFVGFKEHADQLKAENAEQRLPMELMVNTPWGTEEALTIIAVERDDMEAGDFIADCLLGEERKTIRIWWNDEVETAHVEVSVSLDELLSSFAEQWDVLPPIEREATGAEVYELAELPFGPARDLVMQLDIGDPDQELACHVVVYGENAAEPIRTALHDRMTEFPGHDANGDDLPKFVLELMSPTTLERLIPTLHDIQEKAELTFDITIIWNETPAQAA